MVLRGISIKTLVVIPADGLVLTVYKLVAIKIKGARISSLEDAYITHKKGLFIQVRVLWKHTTLCQVAYIPNESNSEYLKQMLD